MKAKPSQAWRFCQFIYWRLWGRPLPLLPFPAIFRRFRNGCVCTLNFCRILVSACCVTSVTLGHGVSRLVPWHYVLTPKEMRWKYASSCQHWQVFVLWSRLESLSETVYFSNGSIARKNIFFFVMPVWATEETCHVSGSQRPPAAECDGPFLIPFPCFVKSVHSHLVVRRGCT